MFALPKSTYRAYPGGGPLERDAQVTTDGTCGLDERVELNGGIGRIEHPVELRSTRPHSPRHLYLGESGILHRLIDFLGKSPLDCRSLNGIEDGVLAQKVVEIRASMFF